MKVTTRKDLLEQALYQLNVATARVVQAHGTLHAQPSEAQTCIDKARDAVREALERLDKASLTER